MIHHHQLTPEQVRALIHQQILQFAGNSKLRIYGKLNCRSGKRMKNKNRVFFMDEKEAVNEGYRPCGHCLRVKFLSWKENI